MIKWIIKILACHFPWLLPDKLFLEAKFRMLMHRELNLKAPATFNEKLQWLKLYDRKPGYTALADKVGAKQFATSVIGEEYIVPTYGVYENASKIPWEELPEQFVLKCTHDSGGLVVCKDKSSLDRRKSSRILDRCLKRNFFLLAREWPYKNVKRRIICEKYLESGCEAGLIDYKFFCFSGKPEFMYVSQGLEDHKTARISFADLDCRQLPFSRKDYSPFEDGSLPVPAKLEEMKALAQKLAVASKAPFIRVDLYENEGKVLFSEMTFYPNGGYIPFSPPEWDEKLGRLITLPVKK